MANVDFANYAEQIKQRAEKWLSIGSAEANRKIAKLLNEANKFDKITPDKTKVKEIEKQIKKIDEAKETAKELGADIKPYEDKLRDLYDQLSGVSYVTIPHKPKTSNKAEPKKETKAVASSTEKIRV